MSRRRTAFLLALFLCFTATAGAEEELTLRVSDAEGVPGGLAAITLRTYASRPIGQGQVCLESRITEPGQAPALAELVDIEVFSSVPDVTTTTTQDDKNLFVCSFSPNLRLLQKLNHPHSMISNEVLETLTLPY